VPRLRLILTRTVPAAAEIYKATRSRLHRLRTGDGDVQVFDRIIAENRWRDPDSASGTGSNLKQTETLRRELPATLSRLGVRTLLDAPCGDFHWMQHLELNGIGFRASGASWMLATTYPSRTRNWDIVTGSWRPINLCAAPFNFPTPVEALIEGSTEYDGDLADKTLAVWRLERLPLT